jgi:outer membrane lipoprotein carrier protein
VTRTLGRLAVALAAAGTVSSLAAQDAGPVLQRAEAAYQTVSTLSAEFVQVVVNPLLGEPDTATGTLYLMRPNHFAMRFTIPEGDRIVADGRHLWLYTPSTTPGQVLRSGIPRTGTTGPNLMGQFVERATERYETKYLRADSLLTGLADVIALAPKSPQGYREAVIWVDRDDALLRRIEIVEESGQRRVIQLWGMRVNPGVPQREFTFKPPRDVRVVDL